MRAIGEWLWRHPWVVTAFALGALFGAGLGLPLIPYMLPEPTAELLGAAAGSAVTVFAALWIARHKERREAAALYALVDAGADQLWQQCDVLVAALSLAVNPTDPQVIYDATDPIKNVTKECERFQKHVKAFENHFYTQGARGLLLLREVQAAVAAVDVRASFVMSDMADGRTYIRQEAIDTLRKDVRVLKSTLHSIKDLY